MALKCTAFAILLWVVIAKVESQAFPNCQDKCGNISIPYPFGTTEGCYRDNINKDFKIYCNESADPPQAFIFGSNVDISDISIQNGEVRSTSFVAKNCYDENGEPGDSKPSKFRFSTTYTFSNKRNKLTVVGCDSYAYIHGGKGNTYNSGCISLCDGLESITNYSCSGIGCCQTAIPKGLQRFNVTAYSFNNHTEVWSFNPCTFAFLVEEMSYNFSSVNLKDLQWQESVPVVLDWVIDNKTCEEAKKNLTSYACQQNSDCTYDDVIGYRCMCSEGFEGNPYIEGGCIDVNECERPNDCKQNCHNLIGSYSCSCLPGYDGNGRKSGDGCTPTITYNYINNDPRPLLIKVAAGVGALILTLVGIGFLLYWRMREKNLKLKKKNFEQNGGLLLLQKLGGRGSDDTAKIFTIEELKNATNDFDDTRIIGKGGFGTVYKGLLPKNKVVAIKMSKVSNQIQSEQFANEFIVLSKINHRNVVKLLGCCLETEVPLLVYEFITKGTLSRHIHDGGHGSMSWGLRLRVASETAGALAYLHSAASPPIIHRDVKPANILLDENFSAKVSDFGDSRLIPAGQTQLDTLVKGTIGYLDPEYLQTSQLTEKSDVYNFGVVLVELLTGEKALSLCREEKKINLVAYFRSFHKQNRLFEILEVRVANEGSAEQIWEVGEIAERCLRVNGEERPTMKEVEMKLEGLRRVEQHQFIEFENNSDETKRLVNESMDLICCSSSTSEFDSLKNQGVSPFEMDGGR